MMKVNTVKIIHESNERGFKTINECDFVEGEHELFSDEVKKTPKELLIEEALELDIDVEGLTVAQLNEAIAEANESDEDESDEDESDEDESDEDESED